MHSIQPYGIDPFIPSYHLLPKAESNHTTLADWLIRNLAEMLLNSWKKLNFMIMFLCRLLGSLTRSCLGRLLNAPFPLRSLCSLKIEQFCRFLSYVPYDIFTSCNMVLGVYLTIAVSFFLLVIYLHNTFLPLFCFPSWQADHADQS